MVRNGKWVVPILGCSPKTEIEEIVYTGVTNQKIRDYDELVKYVADELFTLYLKRGAWVLDIGVWGPRICLKEARKIINSLDGTLMRVETNHTQRCG